MEDILVNTCVDRAEGQYMLVELYLGGFVL
jgi:hypothetical protein